VDVHSSTLEIESQGNGVYWLNAETSYIASVPVGAGTWDFLAGFLVLRDADGTEMAAIGPYEFSLSEPSSSIPETPPTEHAWQWDTYHGPSTNVSGSYASGGILFGKLHQATNWSIDDADTVSVTVP